MLESNITKKEIIYFIYYITFYSILQTNTDIVFSAILRFDTEVDILYHKHGGILNYMIRKMLD
jgi:aconitase A